MQKITSKIEMVAERNDSAKCRLLIHVVQQLMGAQTEGITRTMYFKSPFGRTVHKIKA